MNPLRKIRRSLSLRLVILAIVTAFLLMLIVNITISKLIAEGAKTQIHPHMDQYLDYLAEDIQQNPDREQALEAALPLEIQVYPPGTTVGMTERDQHGPFRIHERDLPDGSTIHFRMTKVDPPKPSGAFVTGLISILVVLFIAWLIAVRMLKPMRRIQKDVETIGSGNLDHRIDYKRNDEFGDLSKTINTMASDIQHMLEAKRELLLAISHELRSPITRAKVSLALLEESKASESLEHDLNEIESIINELLESERLNQGHAVLNKEAVDLNQLVRQVIDENRLEGKIRLELGENLPDVMLDPVRIRLLLKNLVGNALRYSEQTSQNPVISTSRRDGKLEIIVTDSGPGIPEEHIDHLFEPFYRADPSRHRRSGGYGLGLYLCKLIVEAHGGEIGISSKINSGTAVSVRLPMA